MSHQFISPSTRGSHGSALLAFSPNPPARPSVGDAKTGAEIIEQSRDVLHWKTMLFATESLPSDRKDVGLSSTRRDRLGDPFVHVNYNLDGFDYATHEYVRALAGRLTDTLDPADATPFDGPELFYSGAHHMGTCRMGTGPADSVVDSFGKVHGTNNLILAGSSIFVGSSGAMNPTLTITALALRTADYLLDQVL